MFARRLALAALALVPLTSALQLPAQAAEESPAFGYSVGTDPRNWQYSSALHFRNHPWGEYSDTLISLVTRNQALSVDKKTAFESFGIGTAFGAKWSFLRAGLGLELAWAKRLQMDPATSTLAYANSPAFFVEPYIGASLPFLKTDFSELDVRLHWPVYSTDAVFGPRVMLTLWLGGGVESDEEFEEEEEEETEEDVNDEDVEEEEEEEEVAPPAPSKTPAPPAPKPAPKPTPKPAPKK